jgi:hypothetical protein
MSLPQGALADARSSHDHRREHHDTDQHCPRDDGGLGRVLRLPLIASFCEGGHRGVAHRRVAVRVACPLALRTGALCALELRAERQPEGYLNRYQIPHGGLSLWQPARKRMS